MSGLEAFLMRGVEEDLPLIKYFPFDYSNKNLLSELIVIANSFKKCGKGSLQHKNKIFYYRTYVPPLPKEGNNSNHSNSNSNENFSDYFIYSYDCNKKKFFFLFLCDLNYKQKFIDELTNKIFEILDNGAFQDHEIKKESSNQINALFQEYKKMKPNLGKINQLKEINNRNISSNSLNDSSSSSGNNNNNQLNKSKKRIDTRMVFPKMKKTKSGPTVSEDIDDITSMKENETDLSIIFKENFDQDFYEPQISKWRRIKLLNMLLCLIFLIIILILIFFCTKD